MKTALITPSFLDGSDDLGNDRYQRNVRYLRYYTQIQHHLGFDDIVLIDNASPPELREQLLKVGGGNAFSFIRHDERLVRGVGAHAYPYCWRALYAIESLLQAGYKKVIHADSDAFVLSQRLANAIKTSNSGWVTYWNTIAKHPESSLWVLNEDAFPVFRKFTETPWRERVGQWMEWTLPFTEANRQFVVGKFGEMTPPPRQEPWQDAYLQAPLSVPLRFQGSDFSA